MDGKTLECTFDDGKVVAFPYPLPESVKLGRVAEYAQAAQTWLDAGNEPQPEHTEAEAAAEAKANEYVAQARREREVADMTRAKELASAESETNAVSVLDARIAELQAN
jgi:hypothetical protein